MFFLLWRFDQKLPMGFVPRGEQGLRVFFAMAHRVPQWCIVVQWIPRLDHGYGY